MSEDKNLNAGFEAPNARGLSTRAKRVANLYSELLDIGDNLPSQIPTEVYTKARDAVKAMWDAMSSTSKSQGVSKGVYYTDSGNYPKENTFVSVAYSYTWGYSDNPYDRRPARTSVTAMIGSVLTPRSEYINDEEAEAFGIDTGNHKVIKFAIWHNDAAYIFTYFKDIDVLCEKVDIIEADRVVKWAYVDENRLTKAVPDYMLEEAFGDLD